MPLFIYVNKLMGHISAGKIDLNAGKYTDARKSEKNKWVIRAMYTNNGAISSSVI